MKKVLFSEQQLVTLITELKWELEHDVYTGSYKKIAEGILVALESAIEEN